MDLVALLLVTYTLRMAMVLDDFIDLLRSLKDPGALTDVCRKHLLHGTPYVFSGQDGEFFESRKRIADKFNIGFHEVFVVDSAKLGFSPRKRKLFDYDSDVDFAIISETLFDYFLEKSRLYQMDLRRSRRSVTERELKTYHYLLEYVALGWIHLDTLPLSLRDWKDDWFAFFRSISNGNSEVGNYKVAAGVSRSYPHLECYLVSDLQEFYRESPGR